MKTKTHKRKAKRIVASRVGKKWTAKLSPEKLAAAEEQISDSLGSAYNDELVAETSWASFNNVLTAGLYVQRSRPAGQDHYEVVRVTRCDHGSFKSTQVTSPDGSLEHNPIIVCHSHYQYITE